MGSPLCPGPPQARIPDLSGKVLFLLSPPSHMPWQRTASLFCQGQSVNISALWATHPLSQLLISALAAEAAAGNR